MGGITGQIYQFACVTCSIHFERAVTQSNCAKLLTQTVSHELRNPLNCIIMQQDASKAYLKKLKDLISEGKDLDSVKKLVLQQIEMLSVAHKISKTSSKMMLFNVEDLLDFG